MLLGAALWLWDLVQVSPGCHLVGAAHSAAGRAVLADITSIGIWPSGWLGHLWAMTMHPSFGMCLGSGSRMFPNCVFGYFRDGGTYDSQ